MSEAGPEDTLILRSRIVRSADVVRPTRAVVDLDAIGRNVRAIREATATPVLAVVKADAYGHGVLPVARRLEREGVFGFGVALAEEAIELRDAGIRSRILVLNGVLGGAHDELIARDLTPVVYGAHEIEALARAARTRRCRVHLKVDTGMHRLGVPMSSLDAVLDVLARLPGVEVEGVMTHFAAADEDDEFTRLQLTRFAEAVARVRARGHRPTLLHAANTAGALRFPAARFDLVRVGLGLYGYAGFPDESVVLTPAMRLQSEVVDLRIVEAGEGVGYGPTFRAERRSRIGTVPIGYGDGYARALSNRAEVLVRGRRCPVVGNVSMDLIGVDLTDVDSATVGDEVVLLGREGVAQIDASELGALSGTIPYEILTQVSRRVPRAYVGD